MAGQLTNYARQKMINHALGQEAWAIPTNIYMALFLEDPTDAGLFTDEVTDVDTGYVRLDITALFGACNSETGIENDAIIEFTTALIDYGAVKYTALMDSATHGAGNMIYYGALDYVSYIFAGDSFKYKIGRYKLTMD